MKRSMIVWLRIATVLIGVMGAAVLAFSLLGRLDYDVSSAFRWALPFLSVPCYAALVIFWRVVTNIACDRSFCRENVRAMKAIGILAFLDTGAVCILSAVLGLTHQMAFRMLPFVFCIAVMGFGIGVAALALANLVDRARAIKEENDLTI